MRAPSTTAVKAIQMVRTDIKFVRKNKWACRDYARSQRPTLNFELQDVDAEAARVSVASPARPAVILPGIALRAPMTRIAQARCARPMPWRVPASLPTATLSGRVDSASRAARKGKGPGRR